ncbi:MAG: hypothetical protein K2X27_12970 [Candidatus Obscuribacterales bacterium]|nr:hypothetical protein [Candidatus Obscuribacterales bacterium]
MSDEFDKKQTVDEIDFPKPEEKEGDGNLNPIELFKGGYRPGDKQNTINPDKELGRLEIIDEINPKLPILEAKEIPLNRTENLLLNNMRNAVNAGSVEQVQDMLNTLAENPGSIDRVLRAFKAEMEDGKWNTNRVSWEQGKDNNGKEFIRLRLSKEDDPIKPRSSSEVTIGSDGRHSASYQSYKFGARPQAQDPEETLGLFANRNKKVPIEDIKPVDGKPIFDNELPNSIPKPYLKYPEMPLDKTPYKKTN